MAKLAQGAVLVVILSLPPTAWGHELGLVQSPVAVSYYYPVSVQYLPAAAYAVSAVCVPSALPAYPVIPVVPAPAPIYAPPTPAPPSAARPTTSEIPPATPSPPAKPSAAPPSGSPGFGESTSFFDAYSVASWKPAPSGGERCTVDFWNLTDRDLILRINGGPAQILPRGKNVPVAVPRQFTWELQGRESQTTRIEGGDSALQIVIRR
jgi:hypothetical protein